MFWALLTNVGDTAVMLPSMAIVWLWLLAEGTVSVAWGWAALGSVACALVALSKIAYLGWGYGVPAWDFTGISGHSTLAVFVFTSVPLLVAATWPDRWRVVAVVLGLAVGLGVAGSRAFLHYHSPSEVAAGVALGGLSALGCAWLVRRNRTAPSPGRSFLVVAVLLPLFIAYGHRAPTQSFLTHVAMRLAGHDCAYSRGDHGTAVCVPVAKA